MPIAAEADIQPRMRRRPLSVLPIIAFCAVLASAAPIRAESDGERVQNDVRAMIEALYRGDAAAVLQLTHPTVIQSMGGSDAARSATEEALQQISLVGVKLESLSFPRKPEFMQGSGREFAIVPTLIVLAASGQRVESSNFQLGVKDSVSSDWKYVEGSRIDQQSVQSLFPGFPISYEFPKIHRKRL